MEGKPADNITVQTGTVIGSQYAQIVGVVITDNDITLEFVYKIPRPEIKDAHVVARVTLPKEAALGLAETIFKTKQYHEQKRRGKSG